MKWQAPKFTYAFSDEVVTKAFEERFVLAFGVESSDIKALTSGFGCKRGSFFGEVGFVTNYHPLQPHICKKCYATVLKQCRIEEAAQGFNAGSTTEAS